MNTELQVYLQTEVHNADRRMGILRDSVALHIHEDKPLDPYVIKEELDEIAELIGFVVETGIQPMDIPSNRQD